MRPLLREPPASGIVTGDPLPIVIGGTLDRDDVDLVEQALVGRPGSDHLLGLFRLAGHHRPYVMMLAVTSVAFHRVGLLTGGDSAVLTVPYDETVVAMTWHPVAITRFAGRGDPESVVLGSLVDERDRELLIVASAGMHLARRSAMG